MSLTQTCASPTREGRAPSSTFSSKTTFKDRPRPDINARFIAPFLANTATNRGDEWMAGGNSLWIQDKGFAIRSGKGWGKPAYTLSNPGQVYTALAMNGNTAIGGWCGSCNNQGFARGLTVGTKVAGKWSFQAVTLSSTAGAANYLPNRFVGGVAVGSDGALYVALNGFSRRFTEGEGAGIGHVFKSTDLGQAWTSLDGTGSTKFPDVPANSIKVLSDGALVVGTDLGVVYRQPGATAWNRLGTNLPLTVAMDVELGPDGKIYAATHGRGIWSIAKP